MSRREKDGAEVRGILAALLLAGLAARAWALWGLAGGPFAEGLIVDAREYHLWARSILAGHGLLALWAHHSPAYPLLLTFVYSLFGASPWPVYCLQALAGALAAVLCGHAAWRAWRSPAACWAAGLCAALAWPMVYPAGLLLPQSWEHLLAACAFWLLSGGTQPAAGPAAAAGACLGLAASVRPQLAPAVAVAALALRFAWKGSWRPVVSFAAAAAAFSLAWSAYLAANGIPALLQTRSGLNLYIGSHPGASGAAADFPGLEFNAMIHQAVAAGKRGREQDAFFAGRVRDWARSDPAGFGRLWLRRLGLSLSRREIPAGEPLPWQAEKTPPLLSRLDFALLLALGLPGLVLGVRQREPTLLLAAGFAAAGLLGLSAAGAAARYRAPLLPALALAAGFVAVHLRAEPGPRRPLVGAGLAASMALIWLFSSWMGFLSGVRPERNLAIALSLEARAGGTQAARATALLEDWTALHPGDWDALWHLGLMRILGRDWRGAAGAFSLLAGARGRDLPPLHGILSWLRALEGDRVGAAAAAQASFRDDPGSLEACLRAALYAKLGEPKVRLEERVCRCPLDGRSRRLAGPEAEELALVLARARPGGITVDLQEALFSTEEAFWRGWDMGYPAGELRPVLFKARWPFFAGTCGGGSKDP